MGVQRIDNIGIMVGDLDAAVAFFDAIGLELEGRGFVEGRVVDDCIDVDDTRCEIAMMRVPGESTGIELSRFERPAAHSAQPAAPPVNTLGLHRAMFAVDDIEETLRRLEAVGGSLLRSIVDYEGVYRLCYVRAPEGFVVALAQQLASEG
ncbi:VOC family protein [Glutamicibacter sp. PS]|uniref:VOC family protein n=1 Tax=Glutamicibacter sp. PS TaxID=3075634 RepID=UPI00284C19CC|nr:VOC family protein [Glutamicibacter sp. PS]MDR4534449.1 VOC family protein [Glutamicibacter sp. PS]